MRANRRLGFSLMEMMIVLLIVAIVAAASAPLITKKITRNGTGESPWVFTGLGNSIGYNMNGGNNTAIIGAAQARGNNNPRLYIQTNQWDRPLISFGRGNDTNNNLNFYAYHHDNDPANIFSFGFTAANRTVSRASIVLGGLGGDDIGRNSIAIGNNANTSDNSIAIGTYYNNAGTLVGARAIGDGALAIGRGPSTNGTNSIALGSYSISSGNGAIAMGQDAQASAPGSIAIGVQASADPDANSAIVIGAARASEESTSSIAIGNDAGVVNSKWSIAIGTSARAPFEDSVAIGHNAETTNSDQIMLGTDKDTVVIPGNLVVDGNVILARSASLATPRYIYMKTPSCSLIPFPRLTNTASLRILAEIEKDSKLIAPSAIKHGGYKEDSTFMNTYYSDRRLKNVGEKYTAGLEELKKLDFFHYTFKKDENKTPRVGVMAQDLQKVFPDAVVKGEDGYLLIRTEDMFYAVINAVKELDSKISALVEKVDSIVEDITTMKATIEAQQKTIDELKAQNEEIIKTNEKIMKRLEKLEKKKLSKVEE